MDLSKKLQEVSTHLMAISKKIDTIAAGMGKSTKSKPKSAARKTIRKKTKKAVVQADIPAVQPVEAETPAGQNNAAA